MECLLAVLQLCLFDPSAITVSGDLGWQINQAVRYRLSDGTYYTGPIGRLNLTVTVPVSSELSFHYGVEHRSLVETTHDRGEERAIVGFTWKPFAR
jgi:hypothetical protein